MSSVHSDDEKKEENATEIADPKEGSSESVQEMTGPQEQSTADTTGRPDFDIPIRDKINKKLPRSQRKRLIREQRREKRKILKQERVSNNREKAAVSGGNDRETDGCEKNSVNETEDSRDNDNGTRANETDGYTSKRIRLQQAKERCEEALKSGQRIAIDLSLEEHMSVKECGKLAQQLCRLYGANRRSQKPAHVYFTGIHKQGNIYQECLRKNQGFEGYIVDMSEKPYLELFLNEDIVFLTPDSENVLETVEKEKVYVIGGLVDESITNHITHGKAKELGISTARLPIEEKMAKEESGTFIKVLSVNQVFEILLELSDSGDWEKALSTGVPKRTGYYVK